MPAFTNEHVDVNLTNISVAYTNDEYVAGRVFGVVPVPKISDKYFIYNKRAFLSSSGTDPQGKPNSIRRPGTRAATITYDLSSNSFYAEQLARNYMLTDAEIQIADTPLMPMADATEVVTDTILIDNELAVAAIAMKRSYYPTANKIQLVTGTTSWAVNTLSGGNYTSFPITSDIPNSKSAVVLGMQKAPTHFLCNYTTSQVLQANWQYKEYIKYTSRDGLTAGGLVPVLLGLQTIETMAQYTTSADNPTVTWAGSYIWVDDQGENAALVYYGKPATGLKQAAFGATFEAPDASLHTRGFVVKVWREEWLDAEFIEARTTRAWQFIATDGSTNGLNSNGLATGGALISGCTL